MPRLAMSLIVRDEIELISANIEFHAAQGVDHFVVMDNGSKDGTRERIEELKQNFDIELIDQPDTAFLQSEWATQLACQVREKGKADYIISNDADEFWYSSTGTLKDFCDEQMPVIKARRTNMLPLFEDVLRSNFRFYNSIFNVIAPADNPNKTNRHAYRSSQMMLRKMPAKVMCALEGLSWVRRGNHNVDHKRGPAVTTDALQVYHFPVRPFDAFAKRVEFARQRFTHKSFSLEGESDSWHQRRWIKQMETDLLKIEWEGFPLDREKSRDLETQGVIRRDLTIKNFFIASGGE